METQNATVETTTTEQAPAQTQTTETTLDYKKLFEETKAQLGQAEHKIIELKKGKKEESTTTAEEKPLPEDLETFKENLKKATTQEIEKFKMEQSKETFEEILNSLSTNEDEKALIRLNYEKGIVKTGFTRDSLRNDLTNAQILANKPKFEKTISEMKQTMISQKTQAGGSSTGQAIEKSSTTLSEKEEQWVATTAAKMGKKPEEVRAQLIKNKTTS